MFFLAEHLRKLIPDNAKNSPINGDIHQSPDQFLIQLSSVELKETTLDIGIHSRIFHSFLVSLSW
jgi:hypothetical protein